MSSFRCFPLDVPEIPGSFNRKKAISVITIDKLSHVIAEQEVILLQDQLKLLQVEQVPDGWFKEKYGKWKCINMLWAKVCHFQNAGRERNCALLPKVIKSCLSYQNSSVS